VERKNWMKTPLILLALAALAAPLALAQQTTAARSDDAQATKADDSGSTEQGRVVMVPRVFVERKTVGPGDGEDGTTDGQTQVRVFVKQEDGEDGEPVTHTYTWQGEDGPVMALGPDREMFFAPGAERGFLGVELTDLTPELRLHFGAPEDAGVLVGRVEDDSPALRAGLRVGDVITRLDGEDVSSSFALTTRIGGHEKGDLVGLEVVRDGKVQTLSATLETRQRTQIEVGHLLRRIGEDGEGLNYEFDPRVFENKLEGVREYFAGPEWNTRVLHMEGMEEGMQDRLDRLEQEIEQIQQQLGGDLDVDVQVLHGDETEDDEVDNADADAP
jgi:hypothetical protein